MSKRKDPEASLMRVVVALILLSVLFTGRAVPDAHATNEAHTPAWSDNFHFQYPDGSYTISAASPASNDQSAVGYNASAWYNSGHDNLVYLLKNDAVWSVYAHASSQFFNIYDGSSTVSVMKNEIKSFNLTGLKVAVFYGCDTAQYTTNYGDDHITRGAYVAGAGASLGFYGLVYLSGGTTSGPAYTWSKYFWSSMQNGNTIVTAAKYARDKFYAERGNYEGVDKFSQWGNSSQKITPVGYK